MGDGTVKLSINQTKTMRIAKTKRQKIIARLRSTPVLVVTSLVLITATLTQGFGVFAASCSNQTDCQQQINTLNNQNAQAQNSLANLEAQAGSYQAAINALQAQINALQSQITANQAQQAQLQQQIIDNQTKLAQQKATLATDVKAMYVNGQITPFEMLATSNSLSDYIDQQEAYSALQDKIQNTMDQITALQKQLTAQKDQVDQLLQTLTAQQQQVAEAQNEQNSLLSYNESQQASFNAQIQANKSALSQLYAQQAAIIAASFGGGFHYGGTGGYPYANAVCLNYSGDCGAYGGAPYGPYAWGYPPSNQYDGAGWAYRNCTGYAFWRLAQTTGITLTAGLFPNVMAWGGRIGHSIPDFQNLGYRVDKDPNGGAVLAVNTGGNFGHIMYVEGVVNGQAVISQYNAASDGRYSTGTLTNLSGIYFVHIE
jgi:peptidoglycan hydrolase CwlO-like protein